MIAVVLLLLLCLLLEVMIVQDASPCMLRWGNQCSRGGVEMSISVLEDRRQDDQGGDRRLAPSATPPYLSVGAHS